MREKERKTFHVKYDDTLEQQEECACVPHALCTSQDTVVEGGSFEADPK